MEVLLLGESKGAGGQLGGGSTFAGGFLKGVVKLEVLPLGALNGAGR